MTDIVIERVNNIYARVKTNQSIAMELADAFTFEIPDARFNPKVRAKLWDGKIRLLNYGTRQVYAGLAGKVFDYARDNGYSCSFPDQPKAELTDEQADRFIEWLGPSRTPRDYQLDAFKMAIRETRRLFISPTASGKSFMMYLIARYILAKFKRQVLIIVPSTQLVSQLAQDFYEYNGDDEQGLNIWQIRDGADKCNDRDITITTWQAIQNQPANWYKPFFAVFGDEVHTFKAASLRKIMERCNSLYRLGFTGTLDGSETNELVLQGMFGSTHQVTTYAELRAAGYIADPDIKCLMLSHEEDTRKALIAMGVVGENGKRKKPTYADEMKIITESEARRRLLLELVNSLQGNVLCLYQNIDGHLKPMHEMMIERFGKDRVSKIHGSVKTDDRELIRKAYDGRRDSILNASYGTFQQGINIVNIDHIVCMSPTKSRIRLLQSMGRGLRRSETKTKCVIWDIADDLSWKSWKNHTLSHMKDRVMIYNREQFDYKLFSRQLRNVNSVI